MSDINDLYSIGNAWWMAWIKMVIEYWAKNLGVKSHASEKCFT